MRISHTRGLLRVAVLLTLVGACAAPPAPIDDSDVTMTPTPTPFAEGSLEEHAFDSATLGRPLRYAVYLPVGYPAANLRYPVLYLLHGRGDNLASWARVRPELDALIAEGVIPPVVAVMPDAPSSERAGYYVDSAYTGGESPGAQVETALLTELIPHVEENFAVQADRAGRVVGGYSMGGYGALRYALAYPEMFSAAIVLSPAVYTPLPPADSSTREFGAFGEADQRFVNAIYQRLNYPALLADFATRGQPVRIFIAVGDDEYKNPNPEDALHDIDMEAHLAYNRLARVPNVRAELRVLDGGHGWDVWTPGFVAALRYLGPTLHLTD